MNDNVKEESSVDRMNEESVRDEEKEEIITNVGEEEGLGSGDGDEFKKEIKDSLLLL
jgi:hypothetical protein